MNVGVLLSRAAPDTGGGYTFEHEVLESLLRLADESRHCFTVFVSEGRPAQLATPESVQVATLSRGKRIVEQVRCGARAMTRLVSPHGIKRLRYGSKTSWLERPILESGVEMMWYLAPGAATMEVPYITVVWDLQHRLQPYFPEVSHSLEWERRERSYGTVLRRATAVITGTSVGKAEIERFYQLAPERIHILPHPTPRFALDAVTTDDRDVLARHQLEPGYLFYPAQFWPHKNHSGLLKAVAVLKQQHDLALPVVFVGSDKGNQNHVHRLAAEYGVAGQVRCLGFVSRDELVALYRQALATTYVTFFGPENLPPLEAFAIGCPVVASHVPGADEQLGDAALLVDPHDPQEIATAIRSLHQSDSLRASLIERGALRARRFTGDHFVRGVFAILDDFQQVRACWGSHVA